VVLPARGRPPQAAARRAGLEDVEKLFTATRLPDIAERDTGSSFPPASPPRRLVLVLGVAGDRYSLALLEARTGVAVATASSALRAVTDPVRDRRRHLASAGDAAPAALAPAAVASAADPSGAVAPTHVQPPKPTRTPDMLPVGVTCTLGSASPRPTVRVGPEQEGENHRTKDDHNTNDGKEDGVHQIAPAAPIRWQRTSMASPSTGLQGL
jgi:hypothetical protein